MNAPPTTQIYTLSLHDALPISQQNPEHPDAPNVERDATLKIAKIERELSDYEKQIYRYQLLKDRVVRDRKSTRLNSSHTVISYAVFCLKKKNKKHTK